MVHPSLSLSVSLLRGQTADPRGVKGLRRLKFLQTNKAGSAQHRRRQTHMHTRTNTLTCTRINKQCQTNTHTQNDDLCPAWIDFPQQLCTSTVARQEQQWPLTPAVKWPQCHLTLGHWPATTGLSSPRSLCHSSAWSLGQSSVRGVPIELEQSHTKEPLTCCFQPSCQWGAVVWR